jgi:hypothetical protein
VLSYEAKIGQRITPKPNGCWLYNDEADKYHVIPAYPGGPQQNAHRVFYEILVGDIPDGHVLHHECENPGCVNPDHCTPLTPAEHLALHRELAAVA